MEAEDLTRGQMIGLLGLWLGASIPALLFAAWGLWDAIWEAVASRRLPQGARRRRLVGQSVCNLLLAVTFFCEAAIYVLIGAGLVSRVLNITLTGTVSFVVIVPPVVVMIQVAALQINRFLQDRVR